MTPELCTILCVDDEQDILEIVQIALVDVGGYKVSVCNNGAQALARAEEEKPDLLMLDYMMPGMDGAELMAELRKKPSLADVPILFMTARVQPNEVEKYLAMGVAAVIQKPFDPMLLAQQVRDAWDKHHGR